MFTLAQPAYNAGDVIKDFTLPVIINSNNSTGTINSVTADITIIDFFGTWCVPCVRALPGLTELKNKFSDRLSVVLISNEDESKLRKFVAARKKLSFPVVADTNSKITNLFQPPSYPYTIVTDKNSKILAVTDAASITEQRINEWLSGKTETVSLPSGNEKNLPPAIIMNSNNRSPNKLIALSQDFMYAAKTGDAIESLVEKMKAVDYDELVNGLTTDAEKKTFWINAYNAYTQALLQKNPDAYKNRKHFFTSKQIELAGKQFSLDDIEHSFLRRSKVKWSLGHFNKLFPGKTQKELRVDKLDYRIHFALNCGAKSCPPIAFYDDSKIDQQLDIATTVYLAGEAVYDAEKNTLGLPAIMGWFRRDFGGKKKMLELVKEKGIVPATAKPNIHFNKYDWELHLNNFQN